MTGLMKIVLGLTGLGAVCTGGGAVLAMIDQNRENKKTRDMVIKEAHDTAEAVSIGITTDTLNQLRQYDDDNQTEE